MPLVAPELRVKQAAGDRKSFETALASLGRGTIGSLAPSISRYEIGFQVLDQDDDNYCAVGVFGYKIGKRLMYVPMFYRDGVIKGVEQLRDPKRNLSVPLSDNWVNKFLADGGDETPKLVSKSRTKETAQPSLWQLKYPPTKYGSDKGEETPWVDVVKKSIAGPIVRGGGWADAPDLLKEAAENPEIMREVGKLISDYPWFAAAVERFHGLDKLAAAVRRAEEVVAEDARKFAAIKPLLRAPRTIKRAAAPKLTVIRVSSVRMMDLTDGPRGIFGYSPSEASELKAGRNAYRDERAEGEVTAVESTWEVNPGGGSALENPGHSGVYPVLGEDMTLHECAVFFPLVSWAEVPGACVVIRLSDGAYACTARTAVWMLSAPSSIQAAQKWYDKLPKADKLSEKDDRVVAVYLAAGGHLVGSTPFGAGSDGTVYEGGTYPTNEPYWSRPGYHLETDPGRTTWGGKRVRVVASAAKMTTQSNVLYLPEDARYVKLDGDRFRPAYGDDPDRYLIPTIKGAADLSGAKDGNKLEVVVLKKTANGYSIDAAGYKQDRAKSAHDVEADLVSRFGLRPQAARSIVQRTEPYKPVAALVKLAWPYQAPYLENDFPNAPNTDDARLANPSSFADDVVPSESSTSMALTVQDLMPQPGEQDRYRPYPADYGLRVPLGGIGNSDQSGGVDDKGPREDDSYNDGDVKGMASASTGGVKELFDTASLGAIVKRKGVSRVIDKVTRASIKTMNATADALCHLYWNPDDWSERFGDTEVGPIEDQLSDQFKGIGELYLTLMEKSVDGGRDFSILPGIDSTDAADSTNGND